MEDSLFSIRSGMFYGYSGGEEIIMALSTSVKEIRIFVFCCFLATVSLCLPPVTTIALGFSEVVKYVVPKGQPLFDFSKGDSIKVTTKTGYSYYWQSQVLKPTGNVLSSVKYSMTLPKGKSLSDVTTVILTIPPGGSAPLLAPGTCAELGIANVSLLSVAGGRNPALLASQAIAVAENLLAKNPNLKFIFSGFSMGGFGAQAIASHMVDRCDGLLLIGNYYLNPPLSNRLPIVMLVGRTDFHLSYAEKSLREQTDIGTNIQLMTMAGGHGYGSTKAQGNAIKLILSKSITE